MVCEYNYPDRMHKHKGVISVKKGKEYLRLHKVSVKHKDKASSMHHNFELGRAKKALGQTTAKPVKKVPVKKVPIKKTLVKKAPVKQKIDSSIIAVTLDDDNFIRVDLTDPKFKQLKGVRVKFFRKEGRKKRTVGLEIEA